jgi:hypothetical protein
MASFDQGYSDIRRSISVQKSGRTQGYFMRRALQIVVLTLLMLFYYQVLETLYVEFIYPIFGSIGFALRPAEERLPEAWISVIIASVVTPVVFRRVSDFLCVVILLSTIVPTAVMFTMAGIDREILYLTLAMYLIVNVLRFAKVPIYQPVQLSLPMLFKLCLAASVISIIDLIFRVGLSQFSLDFVEVYERRAYVSELMQGFEAYVLQLGMILNSFAVILAIRTKKYAQVVISAAIAVVFFGIVGSKSQIILPILSVGVMYFSTKKHFLSTVIVGIVAFACYITYYYIYTDEPVLLVANTFRRIGFIPVLLNSFYIDYYNSAGYLFWSYSKISFGLLEYRDTLETGNLIGYQYLASAENHANTGLIGSGYMNAGYFGIALYSFILGLIAAFVDKIAAAKGIEPLAAILAVPSMLTVVTSGDLPSMILSGGLGLVLLLLVLMPDLQLVVKSSLKRGTSRDRVQLRLRPSNTIPFSKSKDRLQF